MKKVLFLLLIPVFIGITACHKITAEEAESVILEGEQERLPVILQALPLVSDITLDSIRFVVKDEPMEAYLYTTWKKGKKRYPIIVPVHDIQSSKEHHGYIEWSTDWDSANKVFVRKNLGF